METTKRKARALFIDMKTVKGKKEFMIYAREYFGSAPMGKKINYSVFKKTFDAKSEAKSYAISKAKELQERYKNTNFLTRFLD